MRRLLLLGRLLEYGQTRLSVVVSGGLVARPARVLQTIAETELLTNARAAEVWECVGCVFELREKAARAA